MPTLTKPTVKKANLVHEGRAMKRLMQLLSINGVSGEEREVAEFIIEQLRAAGVPKSWIHIDDVHQRSPRGGNVGNVICKFPGESDNFALPAGLRAGHAAGNNPLKRGGLNRSARVS